MQSMAGAAGSFSRRSLLKGAAVAAVGSVAAGMVGCAPKDASDGAATEEVAQASSYINVAPKDIASTYDVDVVVIGTGGSGAACALQASQNGLSVLMIEMQDGVGGGTRGGISWIFSLGDPYHEAIGMNTYTPAQLLEHELRNSQYRAPGDRWLDLINQSAANVEWIVENGGKIDYFHEIDPAAMAKEAINVVSEVSLPPLHMHGGGTEGCVRPLCEAAQALGTEILLNTKATSLIQQEDGTVTGVYAEGPDGGVQVNAKAVVLATGGFSNNPELLEKAGWDPNQTVMCNMGVENGDGYLFATAAGGQDRIGEAAPMGQWLIEAFPGRSWNDPLTGDNGLTQMGKQILVNERGRRFMNEAVTKGNPIMQVLPTKNNGATYSIFDDAIFDEHFSVVFEDAMAGGLEAAREQLDNALAENIGESFYRCESVNEAAEKFGLDAKALKQTIEAYNAMCDAGADTDFGKSADYLQKIEPPFYIGQMKNGMQVYVGGLNTSDDYEVLTPEYQPIPGLYSIGSDGNMLFKNCYTVSIGSSSFAHSIFSGRKAADAITKFVNA